jgi:hypothetical protein
MVVGVGLRNNSRKLNSIYCIPLKNQTEHLSSTSQRLDRYTNSWEAVLEVFQLGRSKRGLPLKVKKEIFGDLLYVDDLYKWKRVKLASNDP